MSLTDVKPFMRTILNNLNLREHKDGFNFNNIPSSLMEGSYHMEVGPISGGPANQRAHVFAFNLVVRVFFKGYNKPAEAIDDALETGDNILTAALDPAQRLGGDSIKDVIPSEIVVAPVADSNDNAVILQMDFNFNLIECY